MEIHELPYWRFKVEEVSFGAFTVTASDLEGRSIVKRGTDPDAMLEACRLEAHEIQRTGEKKGE